MSLLHSYCWFVRIIGQVKNFQNAKPAKDTVPRKTHLKWKSGKNMNIESGRLVKNLEIEKPFKL